MNTSPLSPLEARVLGVLIEKQRTVPDTYPLTLNALTAGCNQKTSRDPIMNAGEADVQAAIDRLKEDAWILESSGGRVMRYAHNAERVLAIPAQSVALLAVLLLRGPQTVGELRINCDRLHRFADVSAVEAFLHELAARPAGALVVELARAPGARETRWAQLLSGAPAETLAATAGAATGATPANDAFAPAPAGELSALREDIAALQREVAALKAAVAALRDERRV
ncbi:MAG: YceH family protein [Candidatus Levyibacteriota bacterium]